MEPISNLQYTCFAKSNHPTGTKSKSDPDLKPCNQNRIAMFRFEPDPFASLGGMCGTLLQGAPIDSLNGSKWNSSPPVTYPQILLQQDLFPQ